MPRRALAALAALLLLLGLTGPATATKPRAVHGAHGIGDPYFPVDGNGGIDVLRYGVHDRYRFASRKLTGRTVVKLRTTERLRSFDLDFLLPVRRVRLTTGPATFNRPSRHELRIRPKHPIPAGTVLRATIRYAGYPDRYGYQREHNWLANRHEVVAMNEPHMAPWWFPADDHPLDKARINLRLTVPHGYQVVANGLPAGIRRHGRVSTHHWQGGGAMAPYLAFFAAGHFEVRRGVHHGLPWLIAVSRELSRNGRRNALHLLRRTPRTVGWLQRQLGPYPFGSTGGLITALEPGFALENQTRPTYPAFVGPTTVVHELAHQWFGDSVSVHHWRDVWLNEGFATFMEKLYDEDHHGARAQTWLRRLYRATPADDAFWKLRVADPGPVQMFSWPVYARGAMALQALRHRVGTQTFLRILRTWARQRAGGNGKTRQFKALAGQLSHQDLHRFFHAWLWARRKPAAVRRNGL